MAILDGFRDLFGEIFEAFLFAGWLHKTTLVDDGKGGYSSTHDEYPIFVLIEQQTEEMRDMPNFSETDSVLLILQKHLPNGVEIRGDDEVTTYVEGLEQDWKLKAPIMQDPVRAAFKARATEVPRG